jgi:hypothetical protein
MFERVMASIDAANTIILFFPAYLLFLNGWVYLKGKPTAFSGGKAVK